MRNEARFARAAGNRLTGTLTSPNVNVPDQNGLAPAFSSSATCFRLVLGSAFLLLQCSNTLCEHVVEVSTLAFSLHCSQPRRVTFGFAFDELHHALAILVFVVLRIELSLQHLDELLRHVQLFLRRLGA